MAAELYIGLMSGSSANSIDGVLVAFETDSFELLASDSLDIPTKLRDKIFSFNYNNKSTLVDLGELDNEITSEAARLVSSLIEKANLTKDQVRAICFSGQTLAHKPSKGISWQGGNPHILAEQNGIDVLADMRRRDLAAGGQGAPLATAFHHKFFADSKEDRLIINIGGIANLTQLHRNSPIVGFDTGPGNCLMDEWSRKHINQDYDDKGAWAKSGEPIAELLHLILQDSYFSRSPPKSCGRDYFNMNWLNHYLEQCDQQYAAKDVQATLVDLTVLAISLAACGELDRKSVFYLCGGGTNNSYLCERMKQLTECPVFTTEALGADPQLVEAISFAWLGYRSLHHQTGNIPSVTGAVGERVLGAYYKA